MAQHAKGPAVAVIQLRNPPLNTLSLAVLQALQDGLEKADADPSVKAVMICGENGKFSAGADIRGFSSPNRHGPSLAALVSLIESSKKPVVAAIEGIALGGGLEVALGCHYRVAHVKARMGLPEVTLGLLPGAEGTQRLPRLIGVPAALDMITTGKHISASEALKLGLVDEVVEANTVEAAMHLANQVIGQPLGPRRLSLRPVPPLPDTDGFLRAARLRVRERARGCLAPELCVQAVRAATELPFSAGVRRERELFVELLSSGQARALQYAFFAERAVRRWSAPGGAASHGAGPRPLRSAAVIGLGTMGRGIVTCLVKANIPVVALEQNLEYLDVGRKAVMLLLEREAKKMEQDAQALDFHNPARLQFTVDFDLLRDVDLVIEAVFEDMALKKEIFHKLSRICKPEALLCTNTSALDIDEIASATSRPQQVIGTHFFSPAHVMRLLEIIYGRHTSPTAIATAMQLARALRKVGVVVGNCFGFVGNRMMFPYVEQAVFLLEEGSRPEEVDQVLEDFGFKIGPFRMSDLAGLDVGWRSRQGQGLTGPSVPAGTPARQRRGRRYSPVPDLLCESGRFGQKSGTGWYRYERAGGRTATPDPWVHSLLAQYRHTHGIRPRRIDQEEILERCLFALINEGFAILAEGIAAGPEHLDVIYINGYGWPRHRGGPMFYAATVGLPRVLARLQHHSQAHPDVPGLRPSAFLEKLVAMGNPPLKEWMSYLSQQSPRL
ncbi:peroxisomal bifunctional enzyme isoform X1 [Pithys albifrons albifrons]|uniref:peroxisomal bifunctional enzyme isoform X1 n=2 Tax=Pithys albifrons albifrons TaxID=3385563 RepID=UPI003A5D02EA